MKIIQQGSLPGEKTYRSTCQNCKTVFEYQQKEALITSGQRNEMLLRVECPLCKELVYEELK